MIRKILSILLLVAICFTAIVSCKKTTISTADATRNYFPLTLGKYVVYDVDSTRYYGKAGTQYSVKMQMKYVITDTYTVNRKLSYIMDVFSRPYDGGTWVGLSVILVTPTATGLLYFQDNSQYNKMIFPVTEGLTWKGNAGVVVADSEFYYLKDWNYQYHNVGPYYFNGLVSFDNTVTILEVDQNVNYQNVDSAVAGYRTYAKEVYAYNVGMVYKEWTHYTFGPPDTTRNKDGYSVVMRAREHN